MKKSITAANGQVITAEVSDPVITVNGQPVSVTVADIKLSISGVVTPPVEPPPTPGTRKNLILESLFDTTDLATALKGWSDMQRDKSKAYSLAVVNNTLRYELRKSDAITSESKRVEITREMSSEFWFGGRVKMENWLPDNGGESLFQIHSNENAPPLGLLIWGNDIQLTLTPSDDHGSQRVTIGKLSEWNNKWVDFVVHAKLVASGGIVECWVNGINIPVKMSGVTSVGSGANMKLGINKWPWAPNGGTSLATITTRVLYWDSIRIGNASATYEDVRP